MFHVSFRCFIYLLFRFFEQPVGAFLVRDSSQPGCYAVSAVSLQRVCLLFIITKIYIDFFRFTIIIHNIFLHAARTARSRCAVQCARRTANVERRQRQRQRIVLDVWSQRQTRLSLARRNHCRLRAQRRHAAHSSRSYAVVDQCE